MGALVLDGVAVTRPRGPAVLEGVSLTVDPGQVLAVLGESGCGKTTLLRALIGLLPAGWRAEGAAQLGDTALFELDEAGWCAARGRRIGFVFQEPGQALDPTRTALAQVEIALTGRPRAERRAAAVRALGRAGFEAPEQKGHAYPHELSGGQRQRVVLARALALGPELVLADEPTAHLDPALEAAVLERLRAEAESRAAKVVLVTHDLAVARRASHRVLVLYAGRVAELGPTARVLARPRHPYTAALLAAELGRGRRPRPLAGEVPRLDAPPPGCRFHPRCPRAESRCAKDAPALGPVGAAHGFACHHPEEDAP